MAQGIKTGGRQKGSRNKAKIVEERALAASGELPLDYMLRVMRDPKVEHTRRDEMAKAASRFTHAPMAAVEPVRTADDHVPLAERLKEYAREDAIEASSGKVVELKKKNGHTNGHS